MKKSKVPTTKTMNLRRGDFHLETVIDSTTQKPEFVVKEGDQINYQKKFEYQEREYIPSAQATALVLAGALRLPGKARAYTSLPELKQNIQRFIHRYVDLPPVFELICTNYVLLSWQYDGFNELPYLRVRGDYGSGKTRFLNVVGGLLYNPVFASGASSPASIFHLLDSIRGSLVLDESDYRYSDATAEIAKILNNGHAKGFSVLRCEPTKEGGFVARAYNIFGPKIVALRESFSDVALESRFISCDLDASPMREGVPVSLPLNFESEACDMRNQLLWYRLHRVAPINPKPIKAIERLSPRTQQIYQPLLAFFEDNAELEQITQFLSQQEEQLRVQRGLQTEAELLQIIRELEVSKNPLSLSEITKAFSSRFGNRYNRRVTPKWIGSLLRSKLHLTTRKSHGVYIIEENQGDRLDVLYRKFDVTAS